MTKDQMTHIATYNLYLHWVKLYFPQKAVDGAPVRTDDEAKDEVFAFYDCIAYMQGDFASKLSAKSSYGDRLFALLDTIARREARQFRLGEPIPETVKEEAALLFKEVELFFDKDRKNFTQVSGISNVFDP
jgi:hypothetical protein